MEAIINNNNLVEPPWEYFLRKESPRTAGASVASSTPKAVETGIGLGDLVEKGLQLIGIKAKPSCGCAKRKALLNKIQII